MRGSRREATTSGPAQAPDRLFYHLLTVPATAVPKAETEAERSYQPAAALLPKGAPILTPWREFSRDQNRRDKWSR